jgi:hypothetical protein
MGESHFPNHTKTPSAMSRTTDCGHTLPQENQKKRESGSRMLLSRKRNVPSCPSSGGILPQYPLKGVSSNHPQSGW